VSISYKNLFPLLAQVDKDLAKNNIDVGATCDAILRALDGARQKVLLEPDSGARITVDIEDRAMTSVIYSREMGVRLTLFDEQNTIRRSTATAISLVLLLLPPHARSSLPN
jgi:hypothetical protein